MDLSEILVILLVAGILWLYWYCPNPQLQQLSTCVGSAFVLYRILTPTVWEEQRAKRGPT